MTRVRHARAAAGFEFFSGWKMGRRGPAPKPTKLKALAGNPGKRKLNDAEPKPRAGAPACPAWLDAEAKAEWKRILPELQALKLLTKVDRAALAGYCQSYSRWRTAEQAIAKYGLTFETERGPRKRPEVSISEKASALMKGFLQEFGLSPASRSRVHVPTDKPTDPLDAFLNGKKHG
jgi:P27 family predicted phage terminase small subunit